MMSRVKMWQTGTNIVMWHSTTTTLTSIYTALSSQDAIQVPDHLSGHCRHHHSTHLYGTCLVLVLFYTSEWSLQQKPFSGVPQFIRPPPHQTPAPSCALNITIYHQNDQIFLFTIITWSGGDGNSYGSITGASTCTLQQHNLGWYIAEKIKQFLLPGSRDLKRG